LAPFRFRLVSARKFDQKDTIFFLLLLGSFQDLFWNGGVAFVFFDCGFGHKYPTFIFHDFAWVIRQAIQC